MTGVVATGLRGPGAVSISSKVPGGNIHAAPNTQGEGELFVLFVCGCSAYNDIGSILCHERQVNLFEEQKLCSIWEKPNRESLVDS